MIEREYVKEYLNIETDEYDTKIDVLIPVAEGSYRLIRNKDWDVDESGDVIYPDNLPVVVCEMVAWKIFESTPGSPLVSSSRIGDITTSYSEEPLHYGWPRPIVKQIQRFLKGGQ
jgi:hypothetical protein